VQIAGKGKIKTEWGNASDRWIFKSCLAQTQGRGEKRNPKLYILSLRLGVSARKHDFGL